ncbi:hypothetical protein HK104_005576, partial [Borealophlyctis nickersoniae]
MDNFQIGLSILTFLAHHLVSSIGSEHGDNEVIVREMGGSAMGGVTTGAALMATRGGSAASPRENGWLAMRMPCALQDLDME